MQRRRILSVLLSTYLVSIPFDQYSALALKIDVSSHSYFSLNGRMCDFFWQRLLPSERQELTCHQSEPLHTPSEIPANLKALSLNSAPGLMLKLSSRITHTAQPPKHYQSPNVGFVPTTTTTAPDYLNRSQGPYPLFSQGNLISVSLSDLLKIQCTRSRPKAQRSSSSTPPPP